MDKRLHARISTEHICKARFRSGDGIWEDLEVPNLGVGGIGVRIPLPAAEGLAPGAFLEGLRLGNPAVPQEPIKGRVVWCRRERRHGSEFLDAGIRFLDVPARFEDGLASWVKYVTLSGTPFIDFNGMPS